MQSKLNVMEIRKDVKLLTTDNHKTVKGEIMGVKTLVLYLSPYKNNSLGKNLCPKASKGCSKACLFSSGMSGMYANVANGRRNKTELFLSDREWFMEKLIFEIKTAIKKYGSDWDIAIRLNGTSDIVWENIYYAGKNIFEMFPTIQFYDYTKILTRFKNALPSNYSLTISRSEENEFEAIELLKMGYNVAWVFNKVPTTYKGFTVIDGDESDTRFKDRQGVIVGLRYKNVTGKNGSILNAYAKTSGFVTII